jgi:hypothetical protein
VVSWWMMTTLAEDLSSSEMLVKVPWQLRYCSVTLPFNQRDKVPLASELRLPT